ncbi:MAG: flagellar biosynthesis anti-sigma factor FlgM [Methyloprofundus sp.]|nr:flagellar biosynthesis anti-sigma factor FlgM [Methyloprofundus sp.]
MGIEITARAPLADVNRPANKLSGNNQANNKSTNEPVTDSVNLSVNDLLSNLDSIPPDNSARIAELKNKIENGNYVVDSQKLAENIIQNENELATF